jgi:hypothetical protein
MLVHPTHVQVSVRYGVGIGIVESETTLMMMRGVSVAVAAGVISKEIVLECAPEVYETLLVFDVVDCCGHTWLPVRPEHPVLLLLQVLLQLQIIESVGEVRSVAPIRWIERGGVVRVVPLQLLLLIIHVC